MGMFCFASTMREGYLYDVMDKVSMVTTYPYAAECIQVRGRLLELYYGRCTLLDGDVRFCRWSLG